MIALLGLSLALAEPTCGSAPDVEVDSAITALYAAWSRNDEPGFDTASLALTAAIGCLDSVPSRDRVAKIHQAMSLAAFVNGQMGPCRRSIAAARHLDPDWTLPEEDFPPTHPYVAMVRAATEPGPVRALGDIGPEQWVVDGTVQTEVPSERAFLLQITDGGAVTWSGYLWDPADVPAREPRAAEATGTPPVVASIGLLLHGGATIAKQGVDPESGVASWDDTGGTLPSGGVELVGRVHLPTVLGFELAGAVQGPADPVLGGGAAPSARGLVLLGAASGIGAARVYGAARIGGGLDQARAWVSEAEEAALWTVPSLLLGVEAGVRTDAHRVGATFDTQTVFDTQQDDRPPALYGVRLRLDAGHRIAGPLAFREEVEVRHERLGYADSAGNPVGTRSDLDLRLGIGLGLWF